MASSAAFFAMLTAYFNQCPLYPVTNYETACDALALNGQFTFIVVGGGTAGATLGARLSENPNWTTLIIEAGDFPSNLTEVPGTFPLTRNTPDDWRLRTRQTNCCLGLNNAQCAMPQGRCLGGTSCINEMLSIQARQEDYDAWFPDGNNAGWDSSTLSTYFQRVQATMTTTTYQANDPLRNIVVQGASQLNIGYNVPGSNLGYRDGPLSIANSQRWNTAKAYIPMRRTRSNLCIMTNTRVTRLLFSPRTAASVNPTVIGVETDVAGQILASSEVILTAGAINTPKILLLSGIGPGPHLASMGIPIIKDLPVGQNLQDHLFLPSFFVEFPNIQIPGNTGAAALDYCNSRSGPFVNLGIGNLVAFLNTRNNSNKANIELMHITMRNNDDLLLPLYLETLGFNDVSEASIRARNQQASLLAILPILLRPASRGQVTLQSVNPLDPPVILPGYLSVPADINTLLDAIDYLNELCNTTAFAGSTISNFDIPNCRQFTFNTRPYWQCNIRNFATSLSHPAGTCKMGPASDPTAVVDNTLSVYGINGLRVADASIMPTILPCNTMIPIVTIAERCVDFINNAMGIF